MLVFLVGRCQIPMSIGWMLNVSLSFQLQIVFANALTRVGSVAESEDMAGILPGKKRIDATDALGGTAVDRLYRHGFNELTELKTQASEGFVDAENQLTVRAPGPTTLMDTLRVRTSASAAAEHGYTAGGRGRYYQLVAAPQGLDAMIIHAPPPDVVLSSQGLSGLAIEVRNKIGSLDGLDIDAVKTEAQAAVRALFAAATAMEDEDLARVAGAAAVDAQTAADVLGISAIAVYTTAAIQVGGNWGGRPAPQTAAARPGAAATPLITAPAGIGR